MDENEQKQQLSIAYLHAIASSAGYACYVPCVDDDSVDRTVVARGWLHENLVLRSPKIDRLLMIRASQRARKLS